MSSSKRQRPPNYFSRHEQFRLFILCAMLMLVLVMMNEARKPANWKWMWGEAAVSDPQQAGPIDTRVDPPVQRLPTDGFTVEKTDAPSPSGESVGNLLTPAYLSGITAEMLAEVEDNTVLRARENPAWLAMFRILGTKSPAEIRSLSVAKVGFAQLFRQTDVYRGRLVTIAGTARRIDEVHPRSNEAGIEQLFRWIIEPEGGSNSPIVVYSLEKPDELPLGDLREDCEFTGFCFKRWAYAAGDGTRIAPLLLAKNVSWAPPPPEQPARLPSSPAMALLTLGLLAVAIGVALTVYRSTVKPSPHISKLRDSHEDTALDLVDARILPSVGQTLQNLSQKDQ